MSLAVAYTRALLGVDAPLVSVEAHISSGLPSLAIVGLPEAAVRESRDRVRSAILNSGLEFPRRRITVNLAPADLPKGGGRFDLPIALAILAASGQIDESPLSRHEFFGELALSGELRPVPGLLPAIVHATQAHRQPFVPITGALEAYRAQGERVLAANSLMEVCSQLAGGPGPAIPEASPEMSNATTPDLAEVCGQPGAKRALEIAAAGGHHMLMVGPPGAGKSMLASRLPGILPEMQEQEAIETGCVYSIAGADRKPSEWHKRPFRSPHHSASAAALVGGGSRPSPGEISLAHNGVLFLDELPEFPRSVLDNLREPMENREILVSRAAFKARFPANFQLIAAMNPCPCGKAGTPAGCDCSPGQAQRYRARISGPLLDRIDLLLQVPAVKMAELMARADPTENSGKVRNRVQAAHGLQYERSGGLNARLPADRLEEVMRLSEPDRKYLYQAIEKTRQSARSVHRIQRVARTIADLEQSGCVHRSHLAEAISFRLPAIA